MIIDESISEVLREEESLLGGFLSPFTDVMRSAAWGIESLGAKTTNAIKSTFDELRGVMIPGVEYDWEKFKNDEKAMMGGIDAKYQDIIRKNMDALKNSDLPLFMFALDPTATISYKIAPKAPGAALALAEPIVGAVSPKAGAAVGRWKNWMNKTAQNFSLGGGKAATVSGDGSYDMSADVALGSLGEATVNEQQAPQPQGQPQQNQTQQKPQQPKPDLKQLLQNPDFIKAMNTSPVTKKMRQNALNLLAQRIQAVLNADSLQQMQKVVGPELANKIQGIIDKQDKTISKEEQAKLDQVSMKEVQNIYKAFYLKQLKDLSEKLPNAKNDILNTINQLSALK
jgi:hypothetical protein